MKRVLLRGAVPVFAILGRVLFARVSRQRDADTGPRKVLVIKLWAIGEVVMALPVLEAIKRRWPSCDVHMLVGATASPVVAHHPFCDHIIPIDERIFLKPRLRALMALCSRLRKERYDAAVVLHHLFLFGLFAWASGIQKRVGLDRHGEGFALTVRVPRPSGPTHRIQEYLLAGIALGASGDVGPPSIRIPEQDLLNADRLLETLFETQMPFPVIGLLPVGGRNVAASEVASNVIAKRWPVAHYLKLAQALSDQGCRVLILAGPEEYDLKDSLKGAQIPMVRVLIGSTDLVTSMALISRCVAVVTNDSGPMHITDALRVPMIAIFGPTDPRIVGPRSLSSRIVQAHVDCAPCFREDVFPNILPSCDHVRCMSDVTVEQVLKTLREMRVPV